MTHELTVAVAKGRVLEEFQNLWELAGWPWPVTNGRALWFPPSSRAPGLIIARGQDIPMLVQRGIAAFGVVGRDILEEKGAQGVLEVLDLHIARCHLALASPVDHWPDGPVRVATKYPNIAHRYFAERQHPIEVVQLSGSLELAPHIGLAPYIVDIVQTGRTLSHHHLVEVARIMESSAWLIANPAFWRTHQEADVVYQGFVAAVTRLEEECQR
ncbi:MAG: ATP phosphoribosyltransferase [Firmicutes bacterium]|nr:ATP phosphoribosyltransferase [Bacillota bacterium]